MDEINRKAWKNWHLSWNLMLKSGQPSEDIEKENYSHKVQHEQTFWDRTEFGKKLVLKGTPFLKWKNHANFLNLISCLWFSSVSCTDHLVLSLLAALSVSSTGTGVLLVQISVSQFFIHSAQCRASSNIRLTSAHICQIIIV